MDSSTMKRWICSSVLSFDYNDRLTLIQFLSDYFRDTTHIKCCADGSRLNLDILSDDMIRIIYNFVHDTIVKPREHDGN